MTAHHKETSIFQNRYKRGVLAFVEVAALPGNLFSNYQELVALHTQEVMEDQVVASLTKIHGLGKELHVQFVSQTLEQAALNARRSSPLPTVLSRNKNKESKSGSAQRNSLITKLFMSLQSRPDADMKEFFQYENQSEPP